MSEANPPPRWLRSIGAVVAGVITTVILSMATDALMHSIGVFPPLGQPMSGALFLLALAYRMVYGVAGGYLVARLAPDRPMRHALIFGIVGLVATIAGAAATWNAGPEFGPHWYPLALIATTMPCAWAGAKLRGMK